MNAKSSPSFSSDQIAALKSVEGFISDAPNKFSLVGPAGSGKTFVTAEIMKMAQAQRKQVHLTTPTHKACAVLRQATGKNASTIHSLLGAKLKTNFSTGKQFLAAPNDIDYSEYRRSLVLIDEGSMVGRQLEGLTGELVNQGAYVLYIGDSAQLNPVGEKPSVCVDKETCPWGLAELTTIHRQAADNPIIQAATEVRTTGRLTTFGQTSEGLGVVNLTMEDWRDAVLDNCSNLEEQHRCVSYTNEAVDRANRAIRVKAYGKRSEDPYLPGEVLICNSRVILPLGGQIENNTELTVSSSQPEGDMYRIICKDYTGETYSLQAYKSYNERDAVLAKMAVDARKSRNWRKFYEHAESIPDLRHSFALTGHKSQGSTFTDVYINLKELRRCRDADEHRRLLYVALTRASRCVYVTGLGS